MQVVIYSQTLKDKDVAYVQHLFDVLDEFDVMAFVYAPFLEKVKEHIHLPRPVGRFDDNRDFKVRNIDFFITLGGDGTILHASALIQDMGVPIVGINLGRLGFLASVNKEYIRNCIEHLHDKNYSHDQRALLRLDSQPNTIFKGNNFALNDFTILKRDTSSMITIHTYIDGEFLNSYWADGLIVSTPTGSTGYSLSCGGPIIFPNSGNFVITPVAPHNLNVRPIVMSDKCVISFEVEGRSPNFLCTLDNRFETVSSDYSFAVRKADFKITIIKFPEREFLWTMRNKLDWGKDARN